MNDTTTATPAHTGARVATTTNRILPRLQFGKRTIPLSEPEFDALQNAYEAHVELTGTPYGFVAGLLNV